jgi:hypothetical protein
LGGLCHAQDQKGDQGDGDLNAYCVFANADKALDSELDFAGFTPRNKALR